jgi:uncharacterized protein (UPF0218 family)
VEVEEETRNQMMQIAERDVRDVGAGGLAERGVHRQHPLPGAFAASLASSAEQRLVETIGDTVWVHVPEHSRGGVRVAAADEHSTQSEQRRPRTAVPSAKNSGLDSRTGPGTQPMASAVLTGTTDFSTTILFVPGCEDAATTRATLSK